MKRKRGEGELTPEGKEKGRLAIVKTASEREIEGQPNSVRENGLKVG